MKFILIAALFLSLNTWGHELKCNSPAGDLHFSLYEKSGGAAPFPGMLLSQTEWTFQHSTVFLKRTYLECQDWFEGCENREPDPFSNIVWNEIEGTRTVIDQEGELPTYSRTTYSVKMKLESRDGGPMTGIGVTSLERWMICEEIRALYP